MTEQGQRWLVVIGITLSGISMLWWDHTVAGIPGDPYVITQLFLNLLSFLSLGVFGIVIWNSIRSHRDT